MKAETQTYGWRNAFIAILRSPFRYPAWRNTSQVLIGFPLALSASTVVLTLTITSAALAITAILAIPFLVALFGFGRVFSEWQLSRIAAFTGLVLPPVPAAPVGPTLIRRLSLDLQSPSMWRQIGFHNLSLLTSSVSSIAVTACWTLGGMFALLPLYGWALPARLAADLPIHSAGLQIPLTVIGLVLFFAAPTVAAITATLDSALVVAMLAPSRTEELTKRVELLAESRADAIDAADAERRRIERDLHDGAQQRLVSLAMNLGMTRTTMTDVPEPVRAAIQQAHEEAKLALVELRDFVRGLHPAVLDELGLDAALSGIAARSPIPVRLLVELPSRPPRAVETVAYFVVSEALTNAAKHSGATLVDVVVEYSEQDRLVHIIVSDNGCGGADPVHGSGLRGLRQRIRTLDGSMTIQSPPGGPTVLVAVLPCAS